MQRAKYLLIGGGPAVAHAAVSIRERDKEGRCVIAGQEPYPPYDRVPLSKKYIVRDDFEPGDISSKADEFYRDHAVELRPGMKAMQIDRDTRTVRFLTGDEIAYERLLLATGSTPKTLPAPGADLPGVFLLRTISDAERIRERFRESSRVAIVGGGYIGLETAAALRDKGREVVVIDPSPHLWSKFATARMGDWLQRQFEQRGVRFLTDEVAAIEKDGASLAVRAKGGETVAADMVLAGVGVQLNLSLAKEAGLGVDEKQGVKVNERFQTSDPSIWAAGDIACFRDPVLDKEWHAEHHLNAKWTGACAGRNMAGEDSPYDQVAYFFSDMFDLHMILRGDPQEKHEVRVLGDMEKGEFVEVRADGDGRVRCGIAFSHNEPGLDAISDRLEELIRRRASFSELTEEAVGLAPSGQPA